MTRQRGRSSRLGSPPAPPTLEELEADLRALGLEASTALPIDERVHGAAVELCRELRRPPTCPEIAKRIGAKDTTTRSAITRLRQAGRLHPGRGHGQQGVIPRGVGR